MVGQLTMQWGGYTFSLVCSLAPKVDEGGQVCQFVPQARYEKAATIPLHMHGKGPFCHFTIPHGWSMPGVYVIARGVQSMYVGKCENLSARFNAGYGHISPKNCFQGGQPTNCKINARVLQEARAGNTLQLWFLPTTKRDWVESRLIQQLQPSWNGSGTRGQAGVGGRHRRRNHQHR
jgi:hypothetical protein